MQGGCVQREWRGHISKRSKLPSLYLHHKSSLEQRVMLPRVATSDNYDLMGGLQAVYADICEDTMHLWTPLQVNTCYYYSTVTVQKGYNRYERR